jgi:hypothetical protein
MLQVFVPNVLSVFSEICCKYIYLDVAYVLHICYKCFVWMLHMFAIVFHAFLHVFRTHVLNVSVVCIHMLQLFHLYVLKVDRGVVHVAM